MRNLLAGVVAAVWLLASIVLWAGLLQVVPPPSASHAIGLPLAQAVLLAYHLSDVLQTLVGAFLSLALGGLLSGLWLLIEGLARRVRLAVWLGGAVLVIELGLALFTILRVRLLLPIRPDAAGLLAGSSIAGLLAGEMIPAALLLALAVGAVVVGRGESRRRAAPVANATPRHDAGPAEATPATGEAAVSVAQREAAGPDTGTAEPSGSPAGAATPQH